MSDMRVFWAGLALSFLASCGTEVAPRQEGVGFGNYDEYLEARERDQQAAAQGQLLVQEIMDMGIFRFMEEYKRAS